jgi:hypothetical protein
VLDVGLESRNVGVLGETGLKRLHFFYGCELLLQGLLDVGFQLAGLPFYLGVFTLKLGLDL